jgi:Dna[CI] antecedent, DciA
MQRVGELLPSAAQELGLAEPLRRGRQMAAWEHVVAERVPAAAAGCRLLEVRADGAVIVSASSPIIAQELRLRAPELLEAFGQAPGGSRGRELRVQVRRVD